MRVGALLRAKKEIVLEAIAEFEKSIRKASCDGFTFFLAKLYELYYLLLNFNPSGIVVNGRYGLDFEVWPI